MYAIIYTPSYSNSSQMDYTGTLYGVSNNPIPLSTNTITYSDVDLERVLRYFQNYCFNKKTGEPFNGYSLVEMVPVSLKISNEPKTVVINEYTISVETDANKKD